MKPTPRRDLFVTGRSYASDCEPSVAPLVRDCFWLKLDNATTVAFVPEVDPEHVTLDAEPRSTAKARGQIVASERYVVTSSARREGSSQRPIGADATEGDERRALLRRIRRSDKSVTGWLQRSF